MSDYTDIQQELDDFENAVYGEEVRDSMISAIKKIYDKAGSAAGAPDATSATAGQAPIADGSGGWQWGEDSALYEQIGDNFAYIRDYTELGAFSVTDIDAESDNPNRVRSKVFTINALTQIKTIDPTDMLAVYAEDGNGTVTRIANNVNTVTLTDTSLRYRYTGRTADEIAIPVSKIRNFATRNDRNLNLNNRFRDAVAIAVEGGTLNIVQDGSSVYAESSANIAVISNDGYTRVTAGTSETFTPTLNQNYIVYTENGEIKVQSNREDSPITPKEAGKNRIFIGLVRSGELYTWVSENVLFNGATPHIMGGGTGQSKGANLMQIFPIYSVIGDSLACGFMNIDGVSVSSANAKMYGNNWTKYISLRIGRRFNNLAVGGSTTTLWRNTHISTANVATSAYIIGLGINDRRSQVTVGSESDIKSDYTQNSVSTYGNLDYIVNKLKEFNPYCHIFMLTIPAIEDTYNLATFGSCEQQNGAIRYVAGLYDNVHLIDLHDVSGYASELISNTFIANHFNPLSYADMSTLIESTINAYMADNYNLFRTAPYHADGTCEQVSDGGSSAGVSSFNGQTGDVYYTAPVTSVNGQTGTIVVPVPTKTSDLTNDSGYITSAPVTSVNGQTGAVVIGNATTSSAGLMSATDKTNLDTLYADYLSASTALG